VRSGAGHGHHRHLLGWQPSRFLADRGEAERAFALAEQLGSVNAAAAELGTTWPSLRKAFTRHGLGMPARNPEAIRQRAVARASRRAGPPAAPTLDPVFVALNPGQLPAPRGSRAKQGVRLRRAEEIETLQLPHRGRTQQREPARTPAAGGHHRPPPRTRPPPGQRPDRPRPAPPCRPRAARRPPPRRPYRPHQPTPPTPRERDRCRCPMTKPGPISVTVSGRSAPTWSPTWTACPSTS
jgi:hypothetical protein